MPAFYLHYQLVGCLYMYPSAMFILYSVNGSSCGWIGTAVSSKVRASYVPASCDVVEHLSQRDAASIGVWNKETFQRYLRCPLSRLDHHAARDSPVNRIKAVSEARFSWRFRVVDISSQLLALAM